MSYTAAFFRGHEDGSLRSAEVIVPIVCELLRPRSVVDVGCGTGAWLSVFRRHGVEDLLGIDGHYVERRPDEFLPHDLREPLQLDRTFDLVVSLEVAEHLPPDSAETFVDSLTRLGRAVLFSAAVPHQRGVQHVNERWPDYWARLFAARGYVVVDCVRPRVWASERVEVWYAQNTLLFVTPDLLRGEGALAREPRPAPAQLPLVHPAFLEAALRGLPDELTARQLLRRLPRALLRALRYRLATSQTVLPSDSGRRSSAARKSVAGIDASRNGAGRSSRA